MSTSIARPDLRGAMTALVTPFGRGEIDGEKLNELVDRQIAAGTDWLVPCGTTGESPTLTDDEHGRVFEAVVERARGQAFVLAGAGSNCTAKTIRMARRAVACGADAVLIVAPYYNRPTPEGLYRHFAAVADSVEVPVVLYNVPYRTGVEITNDVVVRLRENSPNIVAIKHATGSIHGVTELLARCDIAVVSGDDSLTYPLMCLGAVGVISVVGNLRPDLLKSLVTAAGAGNHAAAARHHRTLYDLAEGLARFGPNPIPIKTAMAVEGLIDEEFRLPLCPMSAESRAGLERLIARYRVVEPALA